MRFSWQFPFKSNAIVTNACAKEDIEEKIHFFFASDLSLFLQFPRA